MGLYVEGPTDARALPVLVRRTAEHILTQRGRPDVDVLEPLVIGQVEADDHAGRILEAARSTHGYHVLLVHADADAPTREKAYQERFLPGLNRVHEAASAAEKVCKLLIPLIPVRMTEAWMIADAEAVREVIGTDVPAADLGLPARPHEVEAVQDPKGVLAEAVRRAIASRRLRRRFSIGSLYEPVAQTVRLECLAGVPAFQQFEQELTRALVALRLAE